MEKVSHSTLFWSLPPKEVARVLQTSEEGGLPRDEIRRRQLQYGENIISQVHHANALRIFSRQFENPLLLILIIAGVVTLVIGHRQDSLFIFSSVLVNAFLGFSQEYKAEKALDELRGFLRNTARVTRDGMERIIDAAELVPGDVVRISQGDRVPADARLVEVNDLRIDEAMLTGEAMPTKKQVDAVAVDASLGDQHSMVFAGTLVTQGTGLAVVCRIGKETELGKIAVLVGEARSEETPLQLAIKRFSRWVGLLLIGLTLIVFSAGISFGYSPLEMFVIGVAIAVSAVPEGLPIAMTVILAIGVQRMSRRKGVIRKLVAAEALGSTTMILTDKTGTLTMARMDIGKLVPLDHVDDFQLLELALLNTHVLVENPKDDPRKWNIQGKVIEIAIVRSAAMRGVKLHEVDYPWKVIDSLPFTAANKYSVSLIEEDDERRLVFLGAPEVFIRGSIMSQFEKTSALEEVARMAEQGDLVIAVATKKISGDVRLDDIQLAQSVQLEGYITLRDSVRVGVKEAIADIERAGIKTVIVTGDHRGTAIAVAQEVGMQIRDDQVLDAMELQALSDRDLQKMLSSVRVIARVSPSDKLRIVEAFQQLGEVVAMTGDGVNDAPSIKRADVGIAMGTGTQVTRDVADLVLLDDNFSTIVAAVEEGRNIRNNIRKAIVYLLSNIADELFLISGSLFAGLPLPLNALQILWVNFFSDSFPAIALGFEKDEDGFAVRRRLVKGKLFDAEMKFLILFIGLLTSITLFVLYWYLLRVGYDVDLVKTIIFAAFSSYTLFIVFSLRNLEKSIFAYSLFGNRYLLSSVAFGFGLIGLSIYLPFFQHLLGTVALPFEWVLGVVGFGVMNILFMEFGKWIYRRR